MNKALLFIILLIVATAVCAGGASRPSHTLTLYVANQSFDLNPVDIKVTLDGVKVLEGIFFAGYGRSWRRYEVELAAGAHVLRAMSRKGGVGLKRRFDVAGGRWAAVAFRYRSPAHDKPAARHFAVTVRDRAFGGK